MLDSRGALHAARGRWRLAATDFAAAVEAGGQSPRTSRTALARALTGLSRAHRVLGDPDQALAAADRALAIAASVYPTASYEVGAVRLERGRALLALQRPQEARPDLEAARASFEKSLGADHPRLADPFTALGQLALAERRAVEAQALLERAWAIRSAHPADGGAREETAFALARALWEAGTAERRRAVSLVNQARDGYSALPDLASQLIAVETWVDARRTSAAARWRPRPL
jgi:tetratricopeptide (TPR) repeat protein